MTVRHARRGALAGILPIMLILSACSGPGTTGVPYIDLGRDMAGVYNATSPSSNLDMRIVLGTRHNVTGRYEDGSGGITRFEGTWRRQADDLFVTLPSQPGLPAELTFRISREVILTEIPRSPFSMLPENAPPTYLEQEVMRLRGSAIVAGQTLQLDLVRVIVDIPGAGGGPGQS